VSGYFLNGVKLLEKYPECLLLKTAIITLDEVLRSKF